MEYSAAPLEAVTGHVFRNVHHKHFPGTDTYYIPFIEPKPNAKKFFSSRELNDILPEHNEGIHVIPQILTNKWEDFLFTAEHLAYYGYTELNLNLGCPAKTVVSKLRGSGFLAVPDQLDACLDSIFRNCRQKVSVKTRIGKTDAEEFEQLLGIYEKYPISELIIHPRTQKELYGGVPDLEAFELAVRTSGKKLCYNGDIRTPDDLKGLKNRFPSVGSWMMGRGLLRNPQLIENIQKGTVPDRKRIRAFQDELEEAYKETLCGEVPVLFKMKEVWCYMEDLFEDTGKAGRTLRKSKKLNEFDAAVNEIFAGCRMKEGE